MTEKIKVCLNEQDTKILLSRFMEQNNDTELKETEKELEKASSHIRRFLRLYLEKIKTIKKAISRIEEDMTYAELCFEIPKERYRGIPNKYKKILTPQGDNLEIGEITSKHEIERGKVVGITIYNGYSYKTFRIGDTIRIDGDKNKYIITELLKSEKAVVKDTKTGKEKLVKLEKCIRAV